VYSYRLLSVQANHEAPAIYPAYGFLRASQKSLPSTAGLVALPIPRTLSEAPTGRIRSQPPVRDPVPTRSVCLLQQPTALNSNSAVLCLANINGKAPLWRRRLANDVIWTRQTTLPRASRLASL